MQNFELPYNGMYAIIDFIKDYGFIKINLEIRNPLNIQFQSRFTLNSRFYMSSDFEEAYGGDLEVESYSLNINDLENAAKILRKITNKINKLNIKFSKPANLTDSIIRLLQILKLDDIRISDIDFPVSKWTDFKPLSINKDFEKIKNILKENEIKAKKIIHKPI